MVTRTRLYGLLWALVGLVHLPLATWGPQVGSEQRQGTGSSWIWVHLGVGLMYSSLVLMLPTAGGSGCHLVFQLLLTREVPGKHPLCPSIHRSASIGWTVPSTPLLLPGT